MYVGFEKPEPLTLCTARLLNTARPQQRGMPAPTLCTGELASVGRKLAVKSNKLETLA